MRARSHQIFNMEFSIQESLIFIDLSRMKCNGLRTSREIIIFKNIFVNRNNFFPVVLYGTTTQYITLYLTDNTVIIVFYEHSLS